MEDLRVIKTKSNIKTTFIQMVGEIGYQKITIKDLCSKAMINRNTFYLHYNDKDELIKTLMKEAVDKIKTDLFLLSNKVSVHFNNQQIDLLQEDLLKILTLFKIDIEIYRIILMDDYLYGYFKGVQDKLEKLIAQFLRIHNKKEAITFKYIFNGFIGVIMDWIVKDTASIEETASTLTNLIYDNVRNNLKKI